MSEKTVTVRRHNRSDGTVVEEHERKIKGRIEELSTPQKAALAIAGAALTAGAGYALARFGGPVLLKPRAADLPPNIDPNSLSWASFTDKQIVRALRTKEFPDLTVLDRLTDASRQSMKAPTGIFRPETYRHLEGSSYTQTLNNIERTIKGLKREHSFLIDMDTGKILFGARGTQTYAPVYVPMPVGRAIQEGKLRLAFTHNHPTNAPYSGTDVIAQISGQISVGRAVEPSGRVTQFTYNTSRLTVGDVVDTMGPAIDRLSRSHVSYIQRMANERNMTMSDLMSDPAKVLRLVDNNDAYRSFATKSYNDFAKQFSPGLYKFETLTELVKMMDDLKIEGEIAKVDADKRQVFGWASVTEINGKPVIDLQNDVLETYELEKAAYDYVLNSRVGGEMHQRVVKSSPKQVGALIESMVITPEKIEKMGLPPETPHGWWIGFKVQDEDVWQNVKKGKYAGFSIHGLGKRLEKNLDEIGKRTITIPQYTRRDGTVVEEHQRKLSVVDSGAAQDAAVYAGLGAGATAIGASYARMGGHKAIAAAYGVYALFALKEALQEGRKGVKLEKVTKSWVEKADAGPEPDDDFNEQVKHFADSVNAEPEEFLARLGEWLDDKDEFTVDDLETFLETYEVVKHLLGRHEQKDHGKRTAEELDEAANPSGKGPTNFKGLPHSRKEHKSLREAKGMFTSPMIAEHNRGARKINNLIQRAHKGESPTQDTTNEIARMLRAPVQSADLRSTEVSADYGYYHRDWELPEKAKQLYTSSDVEKNFDQGKNDMTTKIEFLLSKAIEHADSEPELLDNLADLADEVEKLLVEKSGKEEVSKETIVVEQYTRQDGTVVPRHERKVSTKAALALTGAAGVGLAIAGRGAFNRGIANMGGINSGMFSGLGSQAVRNAFRDAGGRAAGATSMGAGRAKGALPAGSVGRKQPFGNVRDFRTGFSDRFIPHNPTRMFNIGSGARQASRDIPRNIKDSSAFRTGESFARDARAFTGNTARGIGAAGKEAGRQAGARANQFAYQHPEAAAAGIGAGIGVAAYGVDQGAQKVFPAYGERVQEWQDLQERQAAEAKQRRQERRNARREARKSLSQEDYEVLSKYLGRNLG